MVPDDIDHQLDEVRDSTRRLLAALDSLTDTEARHPSLLPDWTNAHVITHLARNADGMAGSLEGAQRGEVVPMYPGGDAGRNHDIEEGACRDAAALVSDLNEAAGRLDEAWSRMDADSWQGTVIPRFGEVPAWRLLRARRQEVEIHRTDLDLAAGRDYPPDSWPGGFAHSLVSDVLNVGLADRLPAGTSLALVASDTGARWTVGEGPDPVAVTGPTWALACWLAGRPARIGTALSGDLPDLTRWR